MIAELWFVGNLRGSTSAVRKCEQNWGVRGGS